MSTDTSVELFSLCATTIAAQAMETAREIESFMIRIFGVALCSSDCVFVFGLVWGVVYFWRARRDKKRDRWASLCGRVARAARCGSVVVRREARFCGQEVRTSSVIFLQSRPCWQHSP